MKCVVILSCLLVAVCSGGSTEFRKQLKSKIMDVTAICIPESNASDDDIAEIMDQKMPIRMEGKCLISCFQKKFGLQTETGEPDKDGLMKLLEPINADEPELYTKVLQIATKCGPQVAKMGLTNHCEIATEIAACATAEGKAMGVVDPFGITN